MKPFILILALVSFPVYAVDWANDQIVSPVGSGGGESMGFGGCYYCHDAEPEYVPCPAPKELIDCVLERKKKIPTEQEIDHV